MAEYQHIIQVIALTLGVGWASGINLYATMFALGYMHSSGYSQLPPDLQPLADPLVMGAAGFMYVVEFFADKTPGVDTGWDALHTFVRIPAGAILAAGAVGEVAPAVELAAAIIGGTLAGGSHLTKAGGRILINASPEPASNWTASVGEDVLTVAGIWAAVAHPVIFLLLLALFVVAIIWLLPKLWRALRSLFRRVRSAFGGSADPSERERRDGSDG